MQSEIAKKAVDMGFDPTQVESTLLQKLRQDSKGYTSVEALIRDITELQRDLDVPEKSGKCMFSFFSSLICMNLKTLCNRY